MSENVSAATTVTLEELPVYVVQTSSADGNSLRLPPAAESTSLEEGGYGVAAEEVSAEELERLSGMWVEDPAPYLVDMRHPVVREEWDKRQLRLGRLPWAPEPLRERRQFDREMVAKYGRIYPPPKRAKWVLATHDIIDQQEERERRRKMDAVRQPVYEEVYIDEEI
ncbi:MAG: hypothetical protein IJO42_00575 [Clostridia bacterium]|nr:hypothetical protein [Clostridia bacterium]